ncbi:hypothetical protein SAMN05216503_3466 [Polaribacter sp. KT25b]|uniref:hypothetical protein n=1 Tax=Polaribacter sp. KT25b TaxID=1855336 RepID=UPI00087A8413|nr:hypothetical protein [Polaribacter sp. KT25b]SDS56538.1 hypothetical protein SAMN05216503_3466 [Polaribacter sp. KT25b]
MKIKIVLFFSILFIGVITAPTVISLVNENQDISIFLSLNEEEEENFEIETFKELKVFPNPYLIIFFKKIQKRKTVRFSSKDYISVFPKITTPPPKLVL